MCEYCEEGKKILNLGGDDNFTIGEIKDITPLIQIGAAWATINYCPMCGRKLQEQAE